MPSSKSRKVRQSAAQKGRRGQLTRKRKTPRPSRPKSIQRSIRQPKKVSIELEVKPIAQIGPSKATIEQTLAKAHKHAKAGRKTKAALHFTLAAAQAAAFAPQHPNVIKRRMMKGDYTSGPVADARGQMDWHLAYPKSTATRYTRRKGWQRRKPGQKTGKKKGRNRRRANKNRKSRGQRLPPPSPIQARLYGIPVRVPRRHTYEFRSN